MRADPRRLTDRGLTSAQVAATPRASVEGSTVTSLEMGGNKKIDIRVVGGGAEREYVGEVANLPLQTSRLSPYSQRKNLIPKTSRATSHAPSTAISSQRGLSGA